MNTLLRKYWIHVAVVIGLLIVAIPSLISWFGYNSAMAEGDMQAVEWLNEQPAIWGENDTILGYPAQLWLDVLPVGTYTCNGYTAPWIYDRFVNKEYVETVEGADFVVVRDKPMTPRCDPENRYYVDGRKVDIEGLELLVEFDGVRVYKGGRS